jgi:signal transduction histidine kinase
MTTSTSSSTSRKLTEEKMLESSRQLIEAQEKERTRIARELHDDLNQRLALLSLEVEQLGRQPPSSADEFRRRTHELQISIRSISADIHRIAYQLHPSKLDTLGLVATLRGLCNEISTRQQLCVKFTHCNVPESLSKDIELCLFRIAQEALSNVIRHSGAQEARVEVTGSAKAIHLRIADAGAGFAIEAVKKRGGLGLISMQERLRLLGGEISIKSELSRGTQIDVQIPLTTQG